MGDWAGGRRATALLIAMTAPGFLLASSSAWAGANPECSACRSSDTRTQVTFSPVISANRLVFDDVTVLDADGQPLSASLYERIPSSNDLTSAYANGPVVMVDSKVGFTIGLNGQSVHANQPFTVTVVRQGETRSVSIEDLNPALTGLVAVEPIGALVFRGVPLQRVKIIQTYETAAASYRFVGIQPAGASDSSLAMRTYGTGKRVIFRDTNGTNGTKSSWSLQMRSSTKSSTSSFNDTDVKVHH